LRASVGLTEASNGRLARVGRIDRSVKCWLQIIMLQPEILLRRRNLRLADDHPPPRCRQSKETRRSGFFEMNSLSDRRRKENRRLLNSRRRHQRPIRHVTRDEPQARRIVRHCLQRRATAPRWIDFGSQLRELADPILGIGLVMPEALLSEADRSDRGGNCRCGPGASTVRASRADRSSSTAGSCWHASAREQPAFRGLTGHPRRSMSLMEWSEMFRPCTPTGSR